MSRLRTALVVAAGLVLIASSAAHSLLGWPSLSARMPVGLIGFAYIAFAAGAAAAIGFDFIEIVFLIPGVLFATAALLPER
ncbi:MAG: hypothetical protein JF589_11520 [Gemmatimonadetes bacterium]|jgi:hypothetical protein|nr:hypothetical protein [Gemmatimonadota bacterium]